MTFVNPGIPGEQFWDTLVVTMHAAARDLNLELEVLHANRKQSRMLELIDQALERETPPDYLVLVNDSNIAARMLPAIEASSSKVLMIIHGVEDSRQTSYGVPGSPYTSWIGSLLPDMESAARHTARALLAGVRQQFASPPYHGLALIGEHSSTGIKRMNHGMLEVLVNAEGVVLDRVLEARWNQQDAERLTARYLSWLARKGKTPDLVWAGNTDMALGAIKALKAVNLVAGEDVLLAGLNWSPDSIEMVEDGRLLLTSGGHVMAGAWAMVMLRDHADNASLPARQIIFPMKAITANNVAIYGPALKQPDYDLVDFASFTRPLGGSYRFNPLDVLEAMMLHQNHQRDRGSDDTTYASSHRETLQ
ncbi:ABC transporter substrate-binding protein [Cobetia amphilecti]|uniref:ABC transporter substrate-binding protein n=1 Tax=Cobetia amphilecti TaxID=1055104 RepID=UPI001C08B234|nr:ABC transporter substrate-binding protein [Cobetia amphilecti]